MTIKFRTRNDVQDKALEAFFQSTSVGKTIILGTGVGKSKLSIDILKRFHSENIEGRKSLKVLIIFPQLPLYLVWVNELEKWDMIKDPLKENLYRDKEGRKYIIDFTTIKGGYTMPEEDIKKYDFAIIDEIHTSISDKYSRLPKLLISNNVTTLGITGTPDNENNLDKELFYKNYIPIVYQYIDGHKEGITNKRRYIIYEHTLNNDKKIQIKTKNKSFYVGEASNYEYIQKEILEAEKDIIYATFDKKPEDIKPHIMEALLENHRKYAFIKSKKWISDPGETPSKKAAGGRYMRAVKRRVSFLTSLGSTKEIAQKMSKLITSKNKVNKVLTFSERIEQTSKINEYCVHSKTGSNIKQSKEINTDRLDKFNKGVVRSLSACNSLNMGVNMSGLNYIIIESYNSSVTNLKQRLGRGDRLGPEDTSNIVIITVKGTKSQDWFEKATSSIDMENAIVIDNLEDFKKLI